MEEEYKDYIVCKICGFKSHRIYGRHLNNHGISSDEYKKMFPDAPLYSESDYINVTRNSGKHMKTEKYRKIFSEKFKGEKNPNHKSKTTKEERQERSPFSIKFKNYSNLNETDKLNKLANFVKCVCDKKSYTVRLDYWLNKGFDMDEANKKLSKRQTTFTLDICIEKYGEEKGKKIYTERQEKWQKSLTKNGNLKNGFSKISQELFYDLLSKYSNEDIEYLYFATKNGEFRLEKEEGGVWSYDFVDIKNKKIIEYNGDLYHANPTLYEANDHPHPFRKNLTAEEIWNKDKNKIAVANEEYFSVLTIWDGEYKNNKEETFKKCLKFLEL